MNGRSGEPERRGDGSGSPENGTTEAINSTTRPVSAVRLRLVGVGERARLVAATSPGSTPTDLRGWLSGSRHALERRVGERPRTGRPQQPEVFRE